MENYYAENLNASKLYEVYQTKIDRVKQYLSAEIGFVRDHLNGDEEVLELGAGYGRIMKELAPFAKSVTGIDISEHSIRFGQRYLKDCPNCSLQYMDAGALVFDSGFDVVLCLQNGISSFKADDVKLVESAMSVLREKGKAYFSSYHSRFWESRLAWFQEQAEKGLLGELDMQRTRDGKIVCKDGFSATTYGPEDMERLGKATGCEYSIQEIDDSSIILVIQK